MIERRKTPRRDWVIGQDDVGRAVLEWQVEQRFTDSEEPFACTEDVIQRLDVPDLSLESEEPPGCDPYDTSSRLRFVMRR